MNNLWSYIPNILVSGGLVIAVLILVIWKFLPWVSFLRKGVLVEGRIEAHHSRKIIHMFSTVTYLSLVYSYDCNGKNYLHEEVVDSGLYCKLKDGDGVKVRYLPKNPSKAELEASAFTTFLSSLMNIGDIPYESKVDVREVWKGD
jgi:uncharacterized protein DUF3592